MRRKLSLFSHSILDLRMMGRLCPIEFNTILLLYLIHSIRVELHWPSNSYRHSERLIFLSNLWVIFRFHTNFQLVNQWVFDGQYDFALRLQILNITLDPFKSISSHRKIFNFVRKKKLDNGLTNFLTQNSFFFQNCILFLLITIEFFPWQFISYYLCFSLIAEVVVKRRGRQTDSHAFLRNSLNLTSSHETRRDTHLCDMFGAGSFASTLFISRVVLFFFFLLFPCNFSTYIYWYIPNKCAK